MLFQIAEPGESRAVEACTQRVVGIDLGTTNSLVAYVADGSPVVIAEDGDPIVPSVVHYDAGGAVLVGRTAEALAANRPRDTIASVKRLIGRGLRDIEAIRGLLPYELIDDGRMVKLAVAGRDRPVTPVEVSAEILRELKVRAEASLGGPIEGVVITVPAYFDDAQRQATRDARAPARRDRPGPRAVRAGRGPAGHQAAADPAALRRAVPRGVQRGAG